MPRVAGVVDVEPEDSAGAIQQVGSRHLAGGQAAKVGAVGVEQHWERDAGLFADCFRVRCGAALADANYFHAAPRKWTGHADRQVRKLRQRSVLALAKE